MSARSVTNSGDASVGAEYVPRRRIVGSEPRRAILARTSFPALRARPVPLPLYSRRAARLNRDAAVVRRCGLRICCANAGNAPGRLPRASAADETVILDAWLSPLCLLPPRGFRSRCRAFLGRASARSLLVPCGPCNSDPRRARWSSRTAQAAVSDTRSLACGTPLTAARLRFRVIIVPGCEKRQNRLEFAPEPGRRAGPAGKSRRLTGIFEEEPNGR